MEVKFNIKIEGGDYLLALKGDIERDEKYFYLNFSYNKALVNEIKCMQNPKWIKENKTWAVPITERNGYALRYLMGHRDNEYFQIFNTSHEIIFNRPLFKHQQEGVQFVLIRKRCMLAFEMGLGKTLTCIEIMERVKQNITNWWLVAPYSAQQEWKRQLLKWKAKVWPTTITTYESLQKEVDKAKSIDIYPQGIIFDESIKIKNPVAQRSVAAYEICKYLREVWGKEAYIIALSGAPAPRDPTDWWHQIECVYPGWIKEGSILKFTKRLANLISVDYGYGPTLKIESWKDDEVERLGKSLAPIVLVKKKVDCLDLPDKIFEIIDCKVTEELQIAAEMIPELGLSSVRTLELLRELSDGFTYTGEGLEYEWIGSPKVGVIKGLLDFYSLENEGPGRFVIYAAYRATIDHLSKCISEKKYCTHEWTVATIDGRGWSNEYILDDFESDNLASNIVIIANPSCVHGITLSKTLCLCYYSNNFSVDARIQSLDRRDRPGADKEKATRVIDICNLSTDRFVLDKLNKSISIQSITIEEIKKCLSLTLNKS